MSFLNLPISGWVFSNYEKNKISPFEKLLEIFKELLTHTSGDFDEAIDWLRELDKEYKLNKWQEQRGDLDMQVVVYVEIAILLVSCR